MSDTVTETTPIITLATDAPRYAAGPQQVAILAGAATGSPVGIVEYTIAPGFAPPPYLQRHTREDAGWVVLDGAVEFHFADGSQITAGPGSSVIHPRGCWFRWRNPDADRPARAICWFSPAGFEEFFVDVAQAANEHLASGGSLDSFPTKLAELRRKYDVEPHPSATPRPSR